MAATPADTVSLECSVCRSPGGGLKLLACRHPFCVACLTDRVSTDSDGVRLVECARCHVITDFDEGETPESLPLAEPEEAKVRIVSTSGGGAQRLCQGPCSTDHVAYCLECNRGLCPICVQRHRTAEQFANHQLQSLLKPSCTSGDPASRHGNTSLYCIDCNLCICDGCANKSHVDHVIKNIYDVAEESRQALVEFARATCGSDPDATLEEGALTLARIKAKHAGMDADVGTWLSALRQLRSQMNALESKMAAVDMGRFARYLGEEADDSSVMAQSAHFPLLHTPTEGATVMSSEVKSVFSREWSDLRNPRLIMPNTAMIPPSPTPSHIHAPPSTPVQLPSPGSTPPITPSSSGRFYRRSGHLEDIREDENTEELALALRCCIQPRGAYLCGGLALDPRAGELVVRTSHPTAPIKVYSHAGELVREVGGQVDGLTGPYSSGVAVDTCRHLYLLPTPRDGGRGAGGGVVVVDREGRRVKSLEGLKTGSVYGVVYGEQEDLYAIADWDKNQVVLVDPRAGCPVGRFSPGYRRPFSLSWRSVGGQPSLMVADWGGEAVTEYTLQGRAIRCFPPSYDGTPINPYGVSADSAGYVIVCDHDNQRLIACGDEDDLWSMLLSENALGGFPHHVSTSIDDDLVAVSLRSGEIRLFDRS